MAQSDLKLLTEAGINDSRPENAGLYTTFYAGELFNAIGGSSDRAPDWWSPRRDIWLRRFYKKVDNLSSATNSMVAKMVAVPPVVIPVNPNIRQHRIYADRYSEMLINNSGIGNGWHVEYSKFMLDYFTQDNGAFMLVMADGNKDEDISGYNRYGLQHLDSARCTRTGNIFFPVVYTDTNGKRYKIHQSRIICISSMPSPDVLANGVGFCAISRALDSAQSILDIAVYKGEKMGSRPLRAVATLSGMSEDTMKQALEEHRKNMDLKRQTRFSHTLLFAGLEKLAFEITDLNSVPDGFDERTTVTLAMYTIAMAFGVDPRELWPATESGATKADAAIQHQKALGKEPGNIMRNVEAAITKKFLPDTLFFNFDAKDDAKDEVSANIRTSRSRYRSIELKAGIVSPRTVRFGMLEDGDIDEDTFQAEELAVYRLPSGDHVKVLFSSEDPFFKKYLDLGKSDPLDFSEGNKASTLVEVRKRESELEWLLANRTDAIVLEKARQAVAALTYVTYKYGDLQPEVILSQIALANPDRDNEIEVVDSPLVPVNVAPDASGGNRSQGFKDSDADVAKSIEKAIIDLRKDYNGYRMAVNELFLNLYYENMSASDFTNQMNALIEKHYKEAYLFALAECAQTTLSLTVQEDLNKQIKEAQGYLPNLVAQITLQQISIEELERRIDLWANQYRRTITLARAFCDGSGRYEWVYHPDKEHCVDCEALNGTVLTLNEWIANGVLPQSPALACGGWQCGCNLVPTTKMKTGVPRNFIKMLLHHQGH